MFNFLLFSLKNDCISSIVRTCKSIISDRFIPYSYDCLNGDIYEDNSYIIAY